MPRSLPILVVDDTEICRIGTALMLEQQGFKTETAANGFDALEKVETGAYGAVIMDYEMAGMTGAECTGRIRELETGTNKHTPIIGLTSNYQCAIRNKCLEAGMAAVLDKACPSVRVLEVLEMLLLQRSRRQ